MQVVVHLRTVEPSDSLYGGSIADDGRERNAEMLGKVSVWVCGYGREREKQSQWGQGKRVCGCESVWGERGFKEMLGTGKESVWVWVCVGKERGVVGDSGVVGDREREYAGVEDAGDRERERRLGTAKESVEMLGTGKERAALGTGRECVGVGVCGYGVSGSVGRSVRDRERECVGV
jgi:hypothetical protein